MQPEPYVDYKVLTLELRLADEASGHGCDKSDPFRANQRLVRRLGAVVFIPDHQDRNIKLVPDRINRIPEDKIFQAPMAVGAHYQ